MSILFLSIEKLSFEVKDDKHMLFSRQTFTMSFRTRVLVDKGFMISSIAMKRQSTKRKFNNLFQ